MFKKNQTNLKAQMNRTEIEQIRFELQKDIHILEVPQSQGIKNTKNVHCQKTLTCGSLQLSPLCHSVIHKT